jgi:hypothetical protein
MCLCEPTARPRSGFHGETDFDGHLPVMHLSLNNVAACFDHLEPTQILDGFVHAFYGLGNSVLDGSGGSAREFDEFIDWVFHTRFFRIINKQTMQRYGVFTLSEIGVNSGRLI